MFVVTKLAVGWTDDDEDDEDEDDDEDDDDDDDDDDEGGVCAGVNATGNCRWLFPF